MFFIRLFIKKYLNLHIRKFNPYNPWTEDKSEKEAENLKVESLDDLFDDEPKKEEPKKETVTVSAAENTQKEASASNTQTLDDMFDDEPTVQKVAPSEIQEEEDTYDLQKELEAKFDELFGPIDD